MVFQDREEAGHLLAQELLTEKGNPQAFVLAIARGGVVLGKVVSRELELPLGVVVVRKIGAPGREELALGAVGPLRTFFWDKKLLRQLKIGKEKMQELAGKASKERMEREKSLGIKSRDLKLEGKKIIVVDDGVATGATVLCVRKYLRKKKAGEAVLATPVIAKDTLRVISRYFDSVVSLLVPDSFYAVGQFYKNFPQISDEEVIKILSNQTAGMYT